MKTIPYYRECVAFFMQHYSEYTGVKYMFEAKDGKALKSILAKIVAIKESHDDTLLLFQQIILELPEWDKRNAFSLTSINSRFNVIVAAIKQQKKVSHGFKEQIINELFK